MNYSDCVNVINAEVKKYFRGDHMNDEDGRLVDAMEYATIGGKRLRSVILFSILHKRNCVSPETLGLCLAAEFLHASSLIIDDLPAFDNAEIRRDRQSTHIIHGESVAILSSINLMTHAIQLIHSFSTSSPDVSETYGKIITEMMKKNGRRAVTGQLESTVDIPLSQAEKLSREKLCKLMENKTSSFFEIPLTLGWVASRGDPNKMNTVKTLALNLGYCYQIYDDFLDYDEDVKGCSHNYVYHRGTDHSREEFGEYKEIARDCIDELDLNCPVFDHIFSLMTI